YLGWSLAHKLAVRVNLKWSLRLYSDSLRLRVLDLGRKQVMPGIHSREHAEQFEGIHGADLADVELAVGEVGFRGNAHAVAVELRIGEGGQQGEFLGFIAGIVVAIITVDAGQPHRKGRKFPK